MVQVGEYWMVYRGPGHLTIVVSVGSCPIPSHPPTTQSKTEKDSQLTYGRRVERMGEEPNHTTAIESLVLCNSFNTLWSNPLFPVQLSLSETVSIRNALFSLSIDSIATALYVHKWVRKYRTLRQYWRRHKMDPFLKALYRAPNPGTRPNPVQNTPQVYCT